MTSTSFRLAALAALLMIVSVAAGCANTIRGIGHDAANAVEATQDAGRSVERAAK